MVFPVPGVPVIIITGAAFEGFADICTFPDRLLRSERISVVSENEYLRSLEA